MQRSTRDSYLEAEVLTATPQRLRKMLLDGAIRFATAARSSLSEENVVAAQEQLDRCSDVIAELLAGISPEDELTRKIADLYVFLLTQLLEIKKTNESSALDDVLEILEIERETWRQVCEAIPEKPVEPQREIEEVLASEAASILSEVSEVNPIDSSMDVGGSFDLDA